MGRKSDSGKPRYIFFSIRLALALREIAYPQRGIDSLGNVCRMQEVPSMDELIQEAAHVCKVRQDSGLGPHEYTAEQIIDVLTDLISQPSFRYWTLCDELVYKTVIACVRQGVQVAEAVRGHQGVSQTLDFSWDSNMNLGSQNVLIVCA